LIRYLAQQDAQSNHSCPGADSKHPTWDQGSWPQHLLAKCLDIIVGKTKYCVEEVIFHDTHYGLTPHVDPASKPQTIGRTALFMLDAEPIAHTIFFHQRFNDHTSTLGVRFQKIDKPKNNQVDRLSDYSVLQNYRSGEEFDPIVRETYLRNVPIEDLHGISIESILTWKQGHVAVFDREQLHCSSSCHKRKKYVVIGYYETG
jgi:hypothetical protein